MENYDGFERDLKRIVGNCKVVRKPEGFVIQIECSKCHEHFEVLSKNKMPPDAINRKLAGQGWKTGHRMICPKHNRREKMAIPKDYSEGVVNPEPKQPPTEPTPAAKRIHRAVLELERRLGELSKKNGWA